MRKTTLAAIAVLVLFLGTATAWAALTDSVKTPTYSMKTLTVVPAANQICTSGLLQFLQIEWNHSSNRNVEYRVVVRSAADNSITREFAWQAAPATVGDPMLQEIRATGENSIAVNGDYWATIEARVNTEPNYWFAAGAPIAIRRTLGLMYCGH